MCAINPKNSLMFTLKVYSSINMAKDEFESLVMEKLLRVEQELNADMRLRWHVMHTIGLKG